MSEVIVHHVEPAGASPSVTDAGLLLGHGVFATMRGYDGACFRPRAHLEHFARGAALLGLAVPRSTDGLVDLADGAAGRIANARVRITLTATREGSAPIFSVLVAPIDVPTADEYARGVASTIVTTRRAPPSTFDGSIKTTSYAPQLLAQREARARGVRDGIQLATDGSLACGTMGNLFVVHGNTLLTPPTSTGCRAGVTRSAVIELAARAGLGFREERLDPVALVEANEAFFTSTRVECLPIAAVDGRAIGRGTFEKTHALREAFRSLVATETKTKARRTG